MSFIFIKVIHASCELLYSLEEIDLYNLLLHLYYEKTTNTITVYSTLSIITKQSF